MYELINNVPLEIKEYHGQRVVTFKDIDNVHQRPEGTAGRNFRTNRKHFIEEVDYFKITPDEFRLAFLGEMDTRQQNDITLVTLSGYLMISKSLTDDLSWSVQRMLVTYFTEHEQNKSYHALLQHVQSLESRITTLESKQTKTRKKIEQNCYSACSFSLSSCIVFNIYSFNRAFAVVPCCSACSLNFSACSFRRLQPRVAIFFLFHLSRAFFCDSLTLI